jgi:opacity protein-like surface antigen
MTDRGARAYGLLGVAVCVALMSFAATARAQATIAERLNLDRLQLSAVGFSVGGAWPSRVEPTQAYSIHADYGEIARNWRVVLMVTYWGSEFKPEVVRELEDAWRNATEDPTGDASISVGRIRIFDVAFEVDGRWTPLRSTALRPFLGAGAGVHVLNSENRILEGTFVESALDMIASGITVLGGVDTAPLGGFVLGVQGRYSFISNTRFFTLRAGASYAFSLPESDQ